MNVPEPYPESEVVKDHARLVAEAEKELAQFARERARLMTGYKGDEGYAPDPTFEKADDPFVDGPDADDDDE